MAQSAIASRRRGETALVVLFLLGVAWFYLWMPASVHERRIEAKPVGAYNELTEAFLTGHLSLKRQPDSRLIALPDPYDPAANSLFRVDNLSYFRGHYYIYMGPAPALTLFAPFRLLTGRYLDQSSAASLMTFVGTLAAVGLFLRLRRIHFGGSPLALILISCFALAFANGYYVATRGAITQEVAIASAYGFAMLTLWALGSAITSKRNSIGCFAAASLFMGLSVASRPNYVFASAILLPPLIFQLRFRSERRPGDLWRTMVAAALPLAIIIGLLLAYNRARFGTAFDFGQRYILGAWNQTRMPNVGLSNVWENVWRYLFAPALYSQYFPFVRAPTWIAVSVLRHVPWIWLAPVAAWALFRTDSRADIRAIGVSALLLGVSNFLTLIFLPSGNASAVLTSANARYLLDFQPALTFFVAIGILATCEAPEFRSKIRCSILVLVSGLAVLVSMVVAISLDFSRLPSDSYRPLAFALDLPAYALEILRGESYGPIDIGLSFPSGHIGSYEPIVSTGGADASDLLYVNYLSPTQVRFGFVSTELKGPISDPVSVAYGVPHHLLVSMGSFFPVDGHPRWSDFGEGQMAFLQRNLHVELDGRTEMNLPMHFHSASPAQLYIGRNPFLQNYAAEHFSGKITSVRRLPMGSSESQFGAESYGAIRIRLIFPMHRVAGTCEPLLVTGVSMAGDIVYVKYLDEDQFRLGIDHWGGSGAATEPIRANFGPEHTITITMGSLFPRGSYGSLSHRLQILFDGTIVLDADQETYGSSPYDVTVGTNVIGGSTCGYAFTGRILGVDRVAPDSQVVGAPRGTP
jgi:hypothetical protein